MAYVAIVAMVALLEFTFFGIKVGQARGRYGVKAPATTGDEMFERYYRVQMNTLEQLIVFLPALLAFAWFSEPVWAALLGLLFVVGRAIYFMSYVADPAKRALGFALTSFANLALIIGAMFGAIRSLL